MTANEANRMQPPPHPPLLPSFSEFEGHLSNRGNAEIKMSSKEWPGWSKFSKKFQKDNGLSDDCSTSAGKTFNVRKLQYKNEICTCTTVYACEAFSLQFLTQGHPVSSRNILT